MKVENQANETKVNETKAPVVKDEVLTEATITEWKAKWGKLFKSTVDGKPYIWRKLRRKEYVDIMSDSDDLQEVPDSAKLYKRQEKITNLVVLFPANIAEIVESDGGLATTISDEVILKSGFGLETTEEI